MRAVTVLVVGIVAFALLFPTQTQTQEEPEGYSGKEYHTIQRIEGGDWIFQDGNWLPMEEHFKHSRNLNVRPGSDIVIMYDKKGKIVNIKKGDNHVN